ncbi:MAG: 50S ribosomal protein L32 [bacterium]|nr:50S ribosomal protein L32 [bacterium]
MPPTQRHTKSRRNRGRSHFALTAPTLALCPKCKHPVLPHQVCLNCGTYRGRVVVDVLARLDKKERKRKAAELAAEEAEKHEHGSGAPLSVEELSRK